MFKVIYNNNQIPPREFTVREDEDFPHHYLISDGESHIGGGKLLKKYCNRIG